MKSEYDPVTAGGCDRCDGPVRNRYFSGKLKSSADYRAEQTYMIARRRLLNRAMLGWGVVSGFAIDADEARALRVGRGVALDRIGREVVACDAATLQHADDLLWLASSNDACGVKVGEASAGAFVLQVHYAERPIDGVRIRDDCGGDRCEHNRVCETVVYSLVQLDCDSGLPDCPGCDQPHYPGNASKDDIDQAVAEHRPPPVHVADRADRGPQSTLCYWSGHAVPRDPCKTSALRKIGALDVALDDGIALACVTVAFDDCGNLSWQVDDQCHVRRLARSNETLFDLIRGCDLTVIDDVGWLNWHQRPDEVFSRRDFRAMFDPPAQTGDDEDEQGEDNEEDSGEVADAVTASRTHFWVSLSGPVQIASLTTDIMTISLVYADDFEDIRRLVRIPIVGIWYDPPSNDDPAGTTRRFGPLVSARYYEGEIRPKNASGLDRFNLVEIDIDGDRVIDAAGQAVDANTRGLMLPSGNGTRGGQFRSRFAVRRGGLQMPGHDDQETAQQQIQGAQ